MEGLLLPLLLFVVMYFALIRPQQTKMKEQQALIKRASEGDKILMASGIYGTITEVVDTACYVELAEGIEILINRTFIQEILSDFPTEAEEQDAADDDEVDDDFEDDVQDQVQDDVDGEVDS